MAEFEMQLGWQRKLILLSCAHMCLLAATVGSSGSSEVIITQDELKLGGWWTWEMEVRWLRGSQGQQMHKKSREMGG